jgi:hypothetical protein
MTAATEYMKKTLFKLRIGLLIAADEACSAEVWLDNFTEAVVRCPLLSLAPR